MLHVLAADRRVVVQPSSGSCSRIATVSLLVGLAALLATLPFTATEVALVPLVAVLTAATLAAWSLRLPVLQRVWRVLGIPVFAGLIGLVVAFTGGADSNYQDLLLLVPVTAALVHPAGRVATAILATSVVAMAPVVYDTPPPGFVSDVVLDTAMWAVVAAVVFVQTRTQRRHQYALRSALAAKSVFLRAVSHELRTPLTVIRGAVGLLHQRHRELTADQHDKLLGQLDEHTRRLECSILDLLDVDGLQQGSLRADAEPVELLALVADSLEALPLVDASRITLGGLPTQVAGDRAKLERVVANLVANALQHTPPETPVWVRVYPEGRHGLLVVEDAGPGVPPELRGRLFEPLEQGHEAATAATPGMGIGLTLVDGLARLQGGSVTLEDRPGGGSRFCVRLPLYCPASPETVPADDPAGSSGAPPAEARVGSWRSR